MSLTVFLSLQSSSFSSNRRKRTRREEDEDAAVEDEDDGNNIPPSNGVGSIGSARHTLCEAADVVSVGIEPGILVFAAY